MPSSGPGSSARSPACSSGVRPSIAANSTRWLASDQRATAARLAPVAARIAATRVPGTSPGSVSVASRSLTVSSADVTRV